MPQTATDIFCPDRYDAEWFTITSENSLDG